MDANELNDQAKNGVDKLLHLTKLIDVISQQHGIRTNQTLTSEEVSASTSFYVPTTYQHSSINVASIHITKSHLLIIKDYFSTYD